MSYNRLPIHCIVPPYVLKKMLDHEDEKVRNIALKTLVHTAEMRGVRRTIGPMAAFLATATGGLRRTIYDGRHKTHLPGALIFGEGDVGSTHDQDAVNAYNGLGDTYNFYKSAFNRNSIDNRGMRLDATVHYGSEYDNAFWNGTQMVFGDGDGRIFNSFTACLDVIGHELTHGVTQYECNLTYQGQSGALNESMSDVFGSLIKQYKLGQTAETADWLIGKGLLVHGGALRSMKAPGTAYTNDPNIGSDPQPGEMSGYIETEDDYGGVHLNSGIPNHAFYLAAIALRGNAWEQAGRIWYAALPTLPPDSTFQQAADLIYQAAVGIYGSNSSQVDAVGNAWAQVGLPPTGTAHLAKPAAAVAGESVDNVVETLADRVVQLVLERVSAQLNAKPRRPVAKIRG
jgi:Zn-dependent metalloprotease